MPSAYSASPESDRQESIAGAFQESIGIRGWEKIEHGLSSRVNPLCASKSIECHS